MRERDRHSCWWTFSCILICSPRQTSRCYEAGRCILALAKRMQKRDLPTTKGYDAWSPRTVVSASNFARRNTQTTRSSACSKKSLGKEELQDQSKIMEGIFHQDGYPRLRRHHDMSNKNSSSLIEARHVHGITIDWGKPRPLEIALDIRRMKDYTGAIGHHRRIEKVTVCSSTLLKLKTISGYT